MNATSTVKALAVTCESRAGGGCDKKAEKRIQLPAGLGSRDLCVGHYAEVCDNVKGCTLAAEQCPACLAISPNQLRTNLLECSRCGCEYGVVRRLDDVVFPNRKCPEDCRGLGYTFAFDLIVDGTRSHGFACRGCRAVRQWG